MRRINIFFYLSFLFVIHIDFFGTFYYLLIIFQLLIMLFYFQEIIWKMSMLSLVNNCQCNLRCFRTAP